MAKSPAINVAWSQQTKQENNERAARGAPLRVMNRDRPFIFITAADFLARSAYQIGKTPLLPIFAVSLGATDTFLGIIVSVSTLSGMMLKPLIGLFSDRWGRRNWLLLATAIFALMPFTYRFVQTPEQLFFVRIVHGIATAIYGPVTLAYVLEKAPDRQAERLGWFGMARSAGYIVGPAAAGWMLLTMSPVHVFTVIGLLSSFAFLPVLALPESPMLFNGVLPPLKAQFRRALKSAGQTPSIWLSGGLEAVTYVALYALRAFLPLYALANDISVAVVGIFFALQEATHMVLKPLGGRLGDRISYQPAICLGLGVLGMALYVLPNAGVGFGLIALALVLGLAQAMIFPSTVALVSMQIDRSSLGAGMGVIGTFRNAGKVLGPVLGGLLIEQLRFAATFQFLSLLLLLSAMFIWAWGSLHRVRGVADRGFERRSVRHSKARQ